MTIGTEPRSASPLAIPVATPLAAPAPSGTGLIPLTVPGPWTSIGHRLTHVAEASPTALAVASTGQQYTYRELLDTATRWAAALDAHLADEPAGRPVALPIEPDARGTVALVAAALSGRPAVPLDPMLPPARAEQLLEASGAIRITVDELAALPVPAAAALPAAGLDDVAIVFFTSGSTGAPKGLAHSHAAWLNQAYSCLDPMELTPADRNALILPLSFGGGLDVLFLSILNGSSVHVYDPRSAGMPGLRSWLAQQGITTVHATPSMLRALLNTLPPQGILTGVRLVSTCGEAIHSATVTRLRSHLEPGAMYFGWSGASEIGVLATFPLPADAPVPTGIIPVGYPGANKTVQVLDEAGDPVGPGVTGEVVITSRYLSQGYFGNPELTRERMTVEVDGRTTYRGGDLGQWDEQGRLHLRGRSDNAVKVGGYLVEPAEVEGALLGLPNISEAAVAGQRLTLPDGQVRTRIVAYVVPAQVEKPVTPASIRRALRDILPTWMVPTAITLLSALPVNERGKVDRLALTQADPEAPTADPAVTPTETLLAELWAAVLGLPDVPRSADFWALGADSLSVEEMLAGAQRVFGADLTLADLSAAPTVAELAAVIDRAGRRTRELPPTAVPLRRGSERPAVFAFAGGGASALSLLPIAKDLARDVPVYGLQASGYSTRARPDWRVRDVVRRHLRFITGIAPDGPRILVGHSFGGILAIETARALTDAGRPAPLVVLLDTRLPDHVVSAAIGAPAPGAPELADVAAPGRRERLAMHARVLGAGLIRYAPELRDSVFWQHTRRMLRRHTMTTWAGRTLLFTVAENPDRREWWEQVLTGELEILPIDGGHSSILRAPFHRPIVERLDAELDGLR